MNYVAAKCPNCGANIEIDDSQEKGICQHCNTEFIAQKAVNNTYITNNQSTQIIKNIYGKEQQDADDYISIGEGFLKIREYGKAKEAFNKAMEREPQNIKVWIGLIKSITKDMQSIYAFAELKKRITEYSKKSNPTVYETGALFLFVEQSFGHLFDQNCNNKSKVEFLKNYFDELDYYIEKLSLSATKPQDIIDIKNETGIVINNGRYKYWIRNNVLIDFNKNTRSSVTITENIKAIGEDAFCQAKIESIKIPNGVTEIGKNAFKDSNIQEIELPQSLEKIGFGAFEGCKYLNNINLPQKLKIISPRAFYGCDELADIVLPPSLESIGSQAFASCESLKSVEIPESVRYMGDYVFWFTNAKVKLISKNYKKLWDKQWNKRK